MNAFRSFADRLSVPTKDRSIWVVGERREAFEAAARLLAALMERHRRLRLVASGPPELLPWLRKRFPEAVAHVRPLGLGPVVNRFLLHASPRTIIALEDAVFSSALLAGVERESMPLVALRPRPDGPAATPAVAAAADATLDLTDGTYDLAAAVDAFDPLLARDRKNLRQRSAYSVPRLAIRALDRRVGARLLRGRLRRIGSLDELRRTLGAPDTILCLGNGPSSEEPQALSAPHDALFRVNASWLLRGLLSDPDVVFTGQVGAAKLVRDAIFAPISPDGERRLVKARLLDLKLPATRYFRSAQLCPELASGRWGFTRPTNGAAMLATAVALAPRRLVVAGVDLFRHPEGAYPGDAATPNAFAPAHDPDAELDFILGLFERHDGDLVIVGDVLKAAWAERSAARGRTRS